MRAPDCASELNCAADTRVRLGLVPCLVGTDVHAAREAERVQRWEKLIRTVSEHSMGGGEVSRELTKSSIT